MLGKHFPGIGSCWLVLRDLGTGPGFTDGEAETRLYRVSVFWVSVKCLMFATGEIFFFMWLDLKFFSGRPTVRSFSKTVYIGLFFSSKGPYFPVSFYAL